MNPIYIMCLERHRLVLNTITYEYMRHNVPQDDMARRGEGGSQPKKPCWIGKGLEDMNGSSKGDMHVVGTTSNWNWTRHIYGTTFEVGSTSVYIWACGGLTEVPPPREVWNISHTPKNHWDNRLDNWTIKCQILNRVIRRWLRAWRNR